MAEKNKLIARATREKKSSDRDLKKLREQAERLQESTRKIEETSKELHKVVGASHRGAHLAHLPGTKGRQAKVQVITKFPSVGIGASAGGLEACTQLLTNLPTDTGMAYVLVQHLDP